MSKSNRFWVIAPHLASALFVFSFFASAAGQTVAPSKPSVEIQKLNDDALKLPFQDRLPALEKALQVARSRRDPVGEALLEAQCSDYEGSLGNLSAATADGRSALKLGVHLRRRDIQSRALDCLAAVDAFIGNNRETFRLLKEALLIQTADGDLKGKALSLCIRGSALANTSLITGGIADLLESISLNTQIGDKQAESEACYRLATLLAAQGRTDEFQIYIDRAWDICTRNHDRYQEEEVLTTQALAATNKGDPKSAEGPLRKAVAIQEEIGDRPGKAVQVDIEAEITFMEGHPTQALDLFKAALKAMQNLGCKSGEEGVLLNMGQVCTVTNRRPDALGYYFRARMIARSIGDENGEAEVLNSIAVIDDYLGNKQKALSALEMGLSIKRRVDDRGGQANFLSNIGATYSDLGQTERALSTLADALKIAHDNHLAVSEALTLNDLAYAYANLRQWGKSIALSRKALPVFVEHKNTEGEATARDDIGECEYEVGAPQDALTELQQALALEQVGPGQLMMGRTLSNIAGAYSLMKHSDVAMTYLEAAAQVCGALGDIRGQGVALRNLGVAKAAQNTKGAYLDFEQALIISRRVKDRFNEADTLSALGALLRKTGKPALAIATLKLSVNVYQSLRKDIAGLPRESQESFRNGGAETYRKLADLLIAQGRISEAQAVLDLLKDFEYFRLLRSTDSQEIALTPRERMWTARYDKFIMALAAQATELEALSMIKTSTAMQKHRIAELQAAVDASATRFDAFLDEATKDFAGSDPKETRLLEVRRTRDLANELRKMRVPTAAIFTLVMPDGIRTILVLPGIKELEGETGQIVRFDNLNDKVKDLRIALGDPHSDPTPISSALYDVLLRPIEPELAKAHIRRLIFSLDGPLRYLPIGALYDSQNGKYLFEKYACCLFVPGDVRGMSSEDSLPSDAVGFGVSWGLTVDNARIPGLPAVSHELEAFRMAFNADVYENSEFTKQRLSDAFHSPPPLFEIATHYQLNPGDPWNSYLLAGTGDLFRTSELKNLPDGALSNVSLLVLSACDTLTPSITYSDGSECESFAWAAKHLGAKSVLGTLWSVDDTTTAMLIGKFYEYLKRFPAEGKLEALRRAQQWLMNSAGGTAGVRRSDQAPAAGQSLQEFHADPKRPFAHPYYWAAFVLTGNPS